MGKTFRNASDDPHRRELQLRTLTRDDEDEREAAIFLGQVAPNPADGFELFLATRRAAERSKGN